jgi:hypothetical protein
LEARRSGADLKRPGQGSQMVYEYKPSQDKTLSNYSLGNTNKF